jgi:hypothetical protein
VPEIASPNEGIPSQAWLYERADQAWCLWIEFFPKGPERSTAERVLALSGPQFVVTETPYCEDTPNGYA